MTDDVDDPTGEIREIRVWCQKGVRGQYVDQKRVEYLYNKYPEQYERISKLERKKAQDELNPLGGK